MEKIYPPELWRASEKMDLAKYFEEYAEKIIPKNIQMNNLNKLQAIKNIMNIDIDMDNLNSVAQICDPNKLTCEGENTKEFPRELPEIFTSRFQLPATYISSKKSSKLNTINCKIQLEKKKSSDILTIGNKRKFHNKIPFPSCNEPDDLVPGSDYILQIMIFKPFAFNYFNAKNTSERLRFNHEILTLGRNTLTELRDAIMCSSDLGLCKEVPNTQADLKPFADAKEKYPSGCIFINDVFYNDFRSEKAIDYSFPIIKWAKDKKIGDFSSERMENVQLNDLKPRLGYPYVYIHQGNCEHIIVFSDARLVQQSDCLNSKLYPHVSLTNRMSNIMCYICGITFAKWICTECDRFPQEKTFLCTDCCVSYNYIDNQKIGSFKLYPFYEKHVTY